MTNDEFLKKDTDVVPEHAPLIILDSKSAVYIENDVKDAKHTMHLSIRMHFVRND